MPEYRLTLEMLADRTFRRRRKLEKWQYEGDVEMEFDHNEVVKSLHLAAADAEDRLGASSQEALFLHAFIHMLQ